MSQERHDTISGAVGVDKFDIHYRQQLSALVDGALAPDEARFLLRRLEHDEELAGCYERWQLCGDVLRGQVRRAADAGFAGRVAAAIADDAARPVARPAAVGAGRRPGWVRWGGGGAALAASVAVVAMFVGRQQAPMLPQDAAPLVAEQRAAEPAPAVEAVQAPSTVPSAVVPAPVLVADAAPASRTIGTSGAAARPAAVRRDASPVATAVAASTGTAMARADAPSQPLPAIPQTSADPFASSTPLQARPWPRAVLPQASSGAFNASFGNAPAAGAAFYPFEPRLPEQSSAPLDLPAPPSDDAPQR